MTAYLERSSRIANDESRAKSVDSLLKDIGKDGYKLNLNRPIETEEKVVQPDSFLDFPPLGKASEADKSSKSEPDSPKVEKVHQTHEPARIDGKVTTKSLGTYLENNFALIDTNGSGKITDGEMHRFTKRNNGEITKEHAFAQENYFALRSLSDDRSFGDIGISRNDVSQLYKDKRPETSYGDYFGSYEGILRRNPLFWSATALGLFMKAMSKRNRAAAFGVAVVQVGSIYDAVKSFHQQQGNVDKLYSDSV